MRRFADRTGVGSERPPRRYLWTDAFAVCNFLALERATGEKLYRNLALLLIAQVHHVLGRYRPDDMRQGWISSLGEQEGALHPTRGGLRIGKELPERGPGAPFDQELEWDRDGQYFHYLTKWMHALDQVARATQQAHFNLWARELAEVAHRSFISRSDPRDELRMVWKMSTDLSRPLVASMGHHDPLDGLITAIQLETTAARLSSSTVGPSLKRAAHDFAAMIEDLDFATTDPLGLGGLLIDACCVAQLMAHDAFADGALLDRLLSGALAGLVRYLREGELRQQAGRRLAFRELGLAIGLHGLALIARVAQARTQPFPAKTRARLETLVEYQALGRQIETFWLEPAHRGTDIWAEHRDINEVMLATCLAPDGCLVMQGL